MLKKIFFAVLFLTAFAACKSKSAFDYSQDFVKKEKSLLPDITATEEDRKSTRLNSSHLRLSRMPSSA